MTNGYTKPIILLFSRSLAFDLLRILKRGNNRYVMQTWTQINNKCWQLLNTCDAECEKKHVMNYSLWLWFWLILFCLEKMREHNNACDEQHERRYVKVIAISGCGLSYTAISQNGYCVWNRFVLKCLYFLCASVSIPAFMPSCLLFWGRAFIVLW